MADLKRFPNGIMFKERNIKAPEYVLGFISIKRTELLSWLSTETDDWINLGVNRSQNGKVYLYVDTWKPSAQQDKHDSQQANQPAANINHSDDLPF